MKRMMMLAALLMCGGVQAQERTAIGGTETQMTWEALSGEITAINTSVKAVDDRVTQVTVCGKKGMLYAPDTPVADAQGCVEASKAGDTTMNITKLSNSLTNVITCDKNGQTFDGTKCVAKPAMSCTAKVVAPATPNNSNMGIAGSCPGGTISSYSSRPNTGSHDHVGDLITTVTCYAVVCQ